jgi:hypothetical protein
MCFTLYLKAHTHRLGTPPTYFRGYKLFNDLYSYPGEGFVYVLSAKRLLQYFVFYYPLS